MRIHLQALGCRLNEAELEDWARRFQARGHQLCRDPGEADLVVVNTCAVTAEAVRKSRKLLRRAHRENPRARLVVSGCSATLAPAAAEALPGVDLVVGNARKDRLVEITETALDLPLMPAQATEPGENALWARGRQRAFVKIQDGCRHRCTYCIVTLARGEERSRPRAEVIDEVRRLHASGVQEVVLTGVHIGGYGADLGTDLADLVQGVLRETRIPRLRLGSLEPWDLPEALWEAFADPRFLPHLHLPLQSGSDRVLRRMARRCRSGEFARLVERGRERVPGLNVTTDIIVGFPGETEADWARTLELAEALGFGHIHIFPFSSRPGTKAAGLPDPVPAEVQRRRAAELHALARRSRKAVLEARRGQRAAVLVEGRCRGDEAPDHWFGYTPDYLQVRLPDPGIGDLGNRILEVELGAPSDDGLALEARLAPPAGG